MVSIKDDGFGIPKEDQDRFLKDFIVWKSKGKRHGGTGLGLSIAKQIAEAHNSAITVKSQVNKGTEMIITIPR